MQLLKSASIGIVITLATLAAAYGLDELGFADISRIVFWPNALMQSFVPAHNIGTVDVPIYEGTPLNFAAFVVSIPLGAIIYSLVAHIFLRNRKGNV